MQINISQKRSHTKRTSSCKSETRYFLRRNLRNRACCFDSRTDCMPDICWRLLYWRRKQVNSRWKILKHTYVIKLCIFKRMHNERTTVNYDSTTQIFYDLMGEGTKLKLRGSYNSQQKYPSTRKLLLIMTSTQLPSFQICIGLVEEPKSFPFSSNRPATSSVCTCYRL